MAWQPDYITAAEFKSAHEISVSTHDTSIGWAITAASRAIDNFTERQFGVITPAAARYYRAYYDHERCRYVALIDDLQTTTSLVVKTNDADTDAAFGNTLTLNTDFRLAPYNAVADGKPWTAIELVPGSAYSLPTRDRSIEITGLWGWTAVPTLVKQACLLQAGRFFYRRQAPFGVAGSPEVGSEMRLLDRVDPDVASILKPYRRMWGAA